MKITDIDMPRQAFIYAAIHLLSNRLQTVGNKLDPTISEKQWFVLAAVSKYADTPPNIGDIANSLGTSRQNIKKIANILEQRGFLKMKKDENDLRNIQLFLTGKCIEYFKGREQKESEYIERIFHGIDAEMLDNLCMGISKLVENIDALLESGVNAER
ncbi:MAG: MarR family transcriptional regulator [Defluviitaleaceae bacterium]|nr:MarR family transcriptional regulator [Defluviitaleaceae bacterium]